ncbi:MAG: hypothetical protein EPN97_15190 [Alphaproteobacteria bacterium]|nr:MAG: hypothetical protein EPN97_15190 [Alphaproteobacteria bacterium]
MKNLLFVALLLISTSAFAAETPTAPTAKDAAVHQKFDEAKSRRLEKINNRIAELQKAQSCVQAATDFNGLESCNSPRFKARMEKKAAATGK